MNQWQSRRVGVDAPPKSCNFGYQQNKQYKIMSAKKIEVGAQVRFLNAVGGGRVARVVGDTAWVEDPDGFEIPTLLRECVVVEQGDTFMPAYKPPTFEKKPVEVEGRPQARSVAAAQPKAPEPERPIKAAHTFLPATGEVSAHLAYLPIDEKRLGQTNYEAYLINDCNYSLYYVYSSQQHRGWKLRAHGIIEPNTKLFVEEFAATDINDLERINIQLVAIAENPGIYKGTYGVEFRLDGRKFFKLHTFEENDFFDEGAWVEPLVCAGVVRGVEVKPNVEALAEAMTQRTSKSEPARKQSVSQPAPKLDEPLVVDLHIDELLDDTTGMGNAEILRYQLDKFNEVMQQHLKHPGRKIVFIHGKGEGVLRNKIEGELRYRYKHCRYQDASFKEYSYGATQVTIGNQPK